MTPVIRVSDDVFKWIQSDATPLVDTADSVLRRWAEQLGKLESPQNEESLNSKMNFSRATNTKKDELKFDYEDRQKIIEKYENLRGVKLQKIGKKKKYFKDSTNHRYVILGGYGTWHGITWDIADDVLNCGKEATILITIKLNHSYKIYEGDLLLLLGAKEKLTEAKGSSQYQFNIIEHGDFLTIKECPSITLKLITELDR